MNIIQMKRLRKSIQQYSAKISRMKPLRILLVALFFACLVITIKHIHSKIVSQQRSLNNAPTQNETAINLSKKTKAKKQASNITATPVTLPTKKSAPEKTATTTTKEAPTTLKQVSLTIKANDTLGELLEQQGVGASTIRQIMQLPLAKKHLVNIIPGEKIEIQLKNNKPEKIKYQFSPTEYLLITEENSQPLASIKKTPVESRIFFADGTIKQSLARAMKNANVSPDMLPKFAHIFNWKVNFKKGIHSGDHFSFLYLQHFSEGKKIDDGDILAAEITNKGTTYQAIQYQGEHTPLGYFTPEGKSLTARFLRHPVKNFYISSGFSKGRRHPVLGVVRPHWGVDFAAPAGTPIHAAADGTINKIRLEKGYGNVIFIQHNAGYSTRYAHMSRFAKNLRRYSRVKKGQVIGYIGSTGVSTGPHLHYEIRKNGKPYDPLKVKLPAGKPVNQNDVPEFAKTTQALLNELKLYRKTWLTQKERQKNTPPTQKG